MLTEYVLTRQFRPKRANSAWIMHGVINIAARVKDERIDSGFSCKWRALTRRPLVIFPPSKVRTPSWSSSRNIVGLFFLLHSILKYDVSRAHALLDWPAPWHGLSWSECTLSSEIFGSHAKRKATQEWDSVQEHFNRNSLFRNRNEKWRKKKANESI